MEVQRHSGKKDFFFFKLEGRAEELLLVLSKHNTREQVRTWEERNECLYSLLVDRRKKDFFNAAW